MKKIFTRKKILLLVALLTLLTTSGFWLFTRSFNSRDNERFAAPGRDWQSQKKVEDYFVERLRMTPEDLERTKERTEVTFRLTKNSTIEAIIGNLYYYGFIRDENALRYTLEHTQDDLPGKEGALMIGRNGTIDINAGYRISEDMSAWQIADTLLNKPEYFAFDEYGYIFMP